MKKLFTLTLAAIAIILCGCKKKNNEPQIVEDGDMTYIIISDVHFGDLRSINEGYGWNLTEIDTLNAFLDYLKSENGWNELIINGDMIDEWVSPCEYPTFADVNGNPITESEFFREVINVNRSTFDRLQALKSTGHKLVYIPGNHDMQVTAEDFESVLPGLFSQARTAGVDGMGEYQPDPLIFIEHGHRYDILNAPYIGKNGIDSIENSILPPGFFISKLDCRPDSVSYGDSIEIPSSLNDVTYDFAWNFVASLYGRKDVVTKTDGMTKTYKFEEYAYSESKLFHNIDLLDEPNDGWTARCNRNKAVLVPDISSSIISSIVYSFCDLMGLSLLAKDEFEPRILVWGHSHAPKMFASQSHLKKGKCIYVNTGCWVDSRKCGADCNSTFCKIHKNKDGEYHVSLCRFYLDSQSNPQVEILKEDSIK